MQTHEDRDFHSPPDGPFRQFMEQLEGRARNMVHEKASEITAGQPDEEPIAKWKACGMHVIQRPDDPQNILRISIGGGISGMDMDYCVFRGKRERCIGLLRSALVALENAPKVRRPNKG